MRHRISDVPSKNNNWQTRRVCGEVKFGDIQGYLGMCDCQMFEFVGIICKHLLKVFVRQHIHAIPDHFILSRWRQEANKFRVMDLEHLVKSDGKEESEALRLNCMCHQATKLACIAASSDEVYTIYIEAMHELSKKLSEVPHQYPTSASPKNDDPCTDVYSSQLMLSDPNNSQTNEWKDINSSSRLESGIEIAMNKKKRSVLYAKSWDMTSEFVLQIQKGMRKRKSWAMIWRVITRIVDVRFPWNFA